MPIEMLGLHPCNFWRLYNLDRIIYYRTRSINRVLAYSKLPDGCVAIHFWDSLPTLDLIYSPGVYDRFREIEERDTVIDCGAHVGIFTLKAAKKAKHGLVIAVEPETFNYEILKTNVRNNKLTNVITVRKALTDKKSRRVRLYLHPFFSEGASLKVNLRNEANESGRYVTVQSTTLDDLAKDCEIDHADVVKMAVNSAEIDVIKGGQRLLQKSEYLAIECDRELSRVRELTNLLLEQGFKKVSLEERLFTRLGFIFFERCQCDSRTATSSWLIPAQTKAR